MCVWREIDGGEKVWGILVFIVIDFEGVMGFLDIMYSYDVYVWRSSCVYKDMLSEFYKYDFIRKLECFFY